MLGAQRRPAFYKYLILFAALMPDLPALLFFVIHLIQLKTPHVWHLYTGPYKLAATWLHSLPVALAMLLVCRLLKWHWGLWFCFSWLLHGIFDFFTHGSDGHAHFFPFSDYVFASPVSYWQVDRFALLFLPVEAALTLFAGWYHYKIHAQRLFKAGVLLILLGYLLNLYIVLKQWVLPQI